MTRIILLLLSSCLITSNQVFALPLNYQTSDTVSLATRFKEKMVAFKKQNKRQIHKFITVDSSITFGSNGEKTFLTSVLIFDKACNQNLWFYFDSIGLFRVTIAERKRPIGEKRKKSVSTYYYENDLAVYKIEGIVKYDPTNLLFQAKYYIDLATQYLNS